MSKKKILLSGICLLQFAFNLFGLIKNNFVPKFVIVVPSYNNRLWFKKNINSLLFQEYPHYRIIYIDDASSDETGRYVREFLEKSDPRKRVLFLRNEVRRGQLANVYQAVHLCSDDEVILVVDGDDFLPHNHVLSYLAMVYKNHRPWLTHGNFKYYAPNSRKKGSLHNRICNVRRFPRKVLENNSIREYQRKTSHIAMRVRTFYAWLFKVIKLKDLLYEDFFYQAATDPSYMVPMIEMAGPSKIHFISRPLYLYNLENPLSYHAQKGGISLQVKMMQHIWRKESYSRLENPQMKRSSLLVDLVYSSDEIYKKSSILPVRDDNFIQTSFVCYNKESFSELSQILRKSSASYVLVINSQSSFSFQMILSCFNFINQARGDIVYLKDGVPSSSRRYLLPHFYYGENTAQNSLACIVNKQFFLDRIKNMSSLSELFSEVVTDNVFDYFINGE